METYLVVYYTSDTKRVGSFVHESSLTSRELYEEVLEKAGNIEWESVMYPTILNISKF